MNITPITYEAFREALGRDANLHQGRAPSEETQAMLNLAVGEAITIETDHSHRVPDSGPVYVTQVCTLNGRLVMAARRAEIKIICRCVDHIVYVLRTA